LLGHENKLEQHDPEVIFRGGRFSSAAFSVSRGEEATVRPVRIVREEKVIESHPVIIGSNSETGAIVPVMNQDKTFVKPARADLTWRKLVRSVVATVLMMPADHQGELFDA